MLRRWVFTRSGWHLVHRPSFILGRMRRRPKWVALLHRVGTSASGGPGMKIASGLTVGMVCPNWGLRNDPGAEGWQVSSVFAPQRPQDREKKKPRDLFQPQGSRTSRARDRLLQTAINRDFIRMSLLESAPRSCPPRARMAYDALGDPAMRESSNLPIDARPAWSTSSTGCWTRAWSSPATSAFRWPTSSCSPSASGCWSARSTRPSRSGWTGGATIRICPCGRAMTAENEALREQVRLLESPSSIVQRHLARQGAGCQGPDPPPRRRI